MEKLREMDMIFPELGLSSYAIDDLLLQDALLDEVEESVAKVVEASRSLFPILVVGARSTDQHCAPPVRGTAPALRRPPRERRCADVGEPDDRSRR